MEGSGEMRGSYKSIRYRSSWQTIRDFFVSVFCSHSFYIVYREASGVL